MRDGSRRQRRDARGHWHSRLAPRHWRHRAAGTVPREATAPGRRGGGPAAGSPRERRIGTGCHSPAQPRACLHRKCLITASFIPSAAVGKGDAVPVAFSAAWDLVLPRSKPNSYFFLGGAPLKAVLIQEEEDGSLLDPGMQQQ